MLDLPFYLLAYHNVFFDKESHKLHKPRGLSAINRPEIFIRSHRNFDYSTSYRNKTLSKEVDRFTEFPVSRNINLPYDIHITYRGS